VARALPLDGQTDGVPNCLHPEVIGWWQAKGYDYRRGFCTVTTKAGPCCERGGETAACPYLSALAALKEAPVVVTTKAFARRPNFFSSGATGNARRQNVVLDEDPIGLLRPPIVITREDLTKHTDLLGRMLTTFTKDGLDSAIAEALHSKRLAEWCWRQIARQPPDGQPEPVPVPQELRLTRAVLRRTKDAREEGRKAVTGALHYWMRRDPMNTVRNVYRDLAYMLEHAAAGTVFVTSRQLLYHLELNIPQDRRVFVLDATANPALLRPVFAPRPVEVLCADRVAPAGRVVQFMDFNGPRSYLNQIPGKVVRIIDALGDLHPAGKLVLISHQSCVASLARASRHAARIQTAHFGALRGRNDLEPRRDNPIACHVVVGSPKTTEEDRRQLALAVFGTAILPFPELVTVRWGVVGRIPTELAGGNEEAMVWEVRFKGYDDPRMQAVYQHTVTAELTHAADRARVLIHPQATVYLVTNEICPNLWFAEMCYAGDFLDLSPGKRADFEEGFNRYAHKAQELLDAGKVVGNADVCRALGRKPGWGKRYWQEFLARSGDALQGTRKFRWKDREE
jgi:hypothetical protein